MEKMVFDSKKMPFLRIALTHNCNFKCFYCPQGGNNYPYTINSFPMDQLVRTVKTALKIGFSDFRITGGEPLLRTDMLKKIVECINESGNKTRVSVTTNGFFIEKNLETIKKLNLDLLRISIDSLKREKFKEITGADCLPQVLKGLDLAIKNSIPVRINTVVTKENLDDVWEIIDFCLLKGIDLKLYDLTYYDLYESKINSKTFWKKSYQKMSKISKRLEQTANSKQIVTGPNGYGIPMTQFNFKSSYIRVKDSTVGSKFSTCCLTCKYYPLTKKEFACQEGLYNPLITANGILKNCELNTDLNIDLNKINLNNETELINGFRKILNNYFEAFHLNLRETNLRVMQPRIARVRPKFC